MNPGPGNYTLNPKSVDLKFDRLPSFVYGKEKRHDLADRSKDSIPAPNVYQVPTTVGQGPKYHIGIRSSSVT